jgi:hypothetical protein
MRLQIMCFYTGGNQDDTFIVAMHHSWKILSIARAHKRMRGSYSRVKSGGSQQTGYRHHIHNRSGASRPLGLVEIGERIKEQEKEQETDYSFLFENENAPVHD